MTQAGRFKVDVSAGEHEDGVKVRGLMVTVLHHMGLVRQELQGEAAWHICKTVQGYVCDNTGVHEAARGVRVYSTLV